MEFIMSEAAKLNISEAEALIRKQMEEEITKGIEDLQEKAKLRFERRKGEINDPAFLARLARKNEKKEIQSRRKLRREEDRKDLNRLLDLKAEDKADRDEQRSKLKVKLNKQIKNSKKNK